MSKIDYYICPCSIVLALRLMDIRHGSEADGFVLSSSDLAPYGIDRAVSEGAQLVDSHTAVEFINRLKK
jgi:hypothetical protein